MAAYFTRAKNISVWDIKGNKYLDMFCAVGTSILGYNNTNIKKSVLQNISKGNLTTLNCPEEVFSKATYRSSSLGINGKIY